MRRIDMISISGIAERLLNEKRAESLRAVDLFEFQVAIFSNSLKERKQARRYAAMKMMERLDVEHGIPKGDIVRALKIDGYSLPSN
jgi:hypothetical protein